MNENLIKNYKIKQNLFKYRREYNKKLSIIHITNFAYWNFFSPFILAVKSRRESRKRKTRRMLRRPNWPRRRKKLRQEARPRAQLQKALSLVVVEENVDARCILISVLVFKEILACLSIFNFSKHLCCLEDLELLLSAFKMLYQRYWLLLFQRGQLQNIHKACQLIS